MAIIRDSRRRDAPWGAANLVVALSLATSAAAHTEAGGVLPGPAGAAFLVLATALLWLVSAATTHPARRSRSGLPPSVVLGGNLALGQLSCHLAYSVGAKAAPTLLIAADGSSRWGDPMAGHTTAHVHAHAMSATGQGHAMAGMHHGSGHHVWVLMLLAHAAAVLVGIALALVLRRMPQAVLDWLRRLTPAPPHIPVVVSSSVVVVPRSHHVRWAQMPPPLLRGPPQLV